MDYSQWNVKRHVISASHIRGYRRGVRDEKKASLQLSVNQYIPKSDVHDLDDAVTIVFIHGVGSTKESYEPFFQWLKNSELVIRSIWAADIAWHGQSFLLNKHIIGDEPHWDDTARDTLHLINTFQADMPPPLVCMGQSWGGYPAVSAALQHPRLFAAVVALEPFLVSDIKVALEDSKLGFASATALSMARRRDVWASRQEARKSLLRNPYYAAFDSDVFERVMQFDLMPTGRGEEVTLVTPKAMEVVTMMRLKDSEKGKRWSDFTGNADQQLSRISYRAEVGVIKSRLPEVRPPVLYVFGTKSIVGKHGYPEWLLKHTGTGEMGSGGVEKDMVNLVWIKGAGHPMPFEKPRETAEAMVPWIKKQIRRWAEESETENAQFYVTKISPFWAERLEKLEKLEKL